LRNPATSRHRGDWRPGEFHPADPLPPAADLSALSRGGGDAERSPAMNITTMLVLNVPPELEEDLVDYLLTLEAVAGFTSFRVHGHGEHAHLSIAEQVAGRRARLRYEI